MKIPDIYRHPKLSERIYRITMSIMLPLFTIANAVVAATRFEDGDVGGGWAAVVSALTTGGVIGFLFWAWPNTDRIREDTRRMNEQTRRRIEAVARDLPIYPSRESTDPYHYAMMRSMETGQPIRIYQGQDGIWRDADTNEPIPAQGGDTNLKEIE